MSELKPPVISGRIGREAICWHCKHAVPTKNDSGVYIRGCSWSICGEPVPGWISKDTPRIKYRGRKRIRYMAHKVQACPLFERG